MIEKKFEDKFLTAFGIIYAIKSDFSPDLKLRFFKCYSPDEADMAYIHTAFCQVNPFPETNKDLPVPQLIQELNVMATICHSQAQTVMYGLWSDCEITNQDLQMAIDMANDGRPSMLQLFCSPENVIVDHNGIINKNHKTKGGI